MPKARSKPPARTAGAPPLAANIADLRALAHPLRLRMLELFAEKPRTTKQVAELLGQPPTRLYHHVAALERAGLLVLKETRPNRGAVEKWYEAVARRMSGAAGAPSSGRAGKGAQRALAMTLLEQARQEMMNVDLGVGHEPPLLVRLIVAAPAATMPEVRKRLLATVKNIQEELCADTDFAAPDDGTYERWALTMAFAPVSAAKGRSRKR